MDDYEVKIWLAAMDLDVSDVEELFQMLDDGQAGETIGIPDFYHHSFTLCERWFLNHGNCIDMIIYHKP